MLLLHWAKGVVSLLLYGVTVLIAFAVVMPLALIKWIVPGARLVCNPLLDGVASAWIEVNSWHQRWLTGTEIRVEGNLDSLSRSEWYLLTANHQSWVDILILVRVLNGRIPHVKFFFKKELLWVPFFGQALWAVDFPVMHRHSKATLARNPELATQDVERTRRACEIFRHSPVTIINFLEGTRFTPAKHRAQGSSYRYLLRPKAGGIAFALSAMNDRLRDLLDVTLFYPDGRPTFWDYACGRVPAVEMHLRRLRLTDDLMGNYTDDQAFREHFQSWVNALWQDKDARLERMKKASSK